MTTTTDASVSIASDACGHDGVSGEENPVAVFIDADGTGAMAEGIVGGVLGSRNISDYINSLRRLRALRVDLLLPGHGRNSANALDNIDVGIERLETLLYESREVFNSLKSASHGFDSVMRSLRELNQR